MRKEVLGGAVGDRTPERAAAAAKPHPAGFDQQVERAARNGNAADLLDLGARHRLMIGDDGERLDRRARKLFRLADVLGHQRAKVGGGADRPLARNLDDVDPAAAVAFRKPGDQLPEVGARREPLLQHLLVEGLGGSEQDCLQEPQCLVALGGGRGRSLLKFLRAHDTHWRLAPFFCGGPSRRRRNHSGEKALSA